MMKPIRKSKNSSVKQKWQHDNGFAYLPDFLNYTVFSENKT